MRAAVLLLLFVAGCRGAPAVPAGGGAAKGATGSAGHGAKVAIVPQTVPSSQYHAQDELGQYTFGYTSSDGQAKAEIKGIDGSIAGKYSYIDANGKRVEVSYVADDKGFRASGDHLPNGVPEMPDFLKQAYKDANARLAAAYSSNKAKAAKASAGETEAAASASVESSAPKQHVSSPAVSASVPESKPKEVEAEAESGGGGGGEGSEEGGGGGGGGEETSGEEEEEGGSEGGGEEEEGGEGGEGGEEGGEGGEGGAAEEKSSKSHSAAKPEVAAPAPAPAPVAAPAPQQHTGALYRLPQASPYGGAQFAFVSSANPGQYVRFHQVPAQAVYAGAHPQVAVAAATAPVAARPAVAQQQQQQQQQGYPVQVRFIAIPQHHVQQQRPQQLVNHYAQVPSAAVGGAAVAAPSHMIPRYAASPYYGHQ